MSFKFNPTLIRLLPFVLVAVALIMAPHTPVRADAAPQQTICGNVDLASANSSDAAKAFDCFNTAYSHCDQATIVASGNDAGVPTTWTFMTVYGNTYGCNVSETVERGTGSSKTTDATLCKTVTRDKDGLRITGCANAKDVALRVSSSYGQVSQ